MYPQAHKLGLPRLVEPRTHRGASGLLESTLRAASAGGMTHSVFRPIQRHGRLTSIMLSRLMVVAAQDRRILIEVPTKKPRWCNTPPQTLQCFYQPWTNCSLDQKGADVIHASRPAQPRLRCLRRRCPCERRLLTRQRPHARAGPAVGIAQQPGLSLCGAARRRRLGHARRSAAARRSKLPRPALLPRPAPLPALRLRRPRPAPPERDERHALGGGRPLLLKGARGRGRHRLPRRRAETASRRRAELRRLRGCGLRPAPPLAPLAAAAPLPRPRQQPHRTEGRARLLVVRLRHRRGGRSRREPARAARG
mmetsp:Transcript_38478/g.121228  ORF Transcript_38478/g.121228 Transcript_38478/m.121228 type:complete len:309 (+) Transcript_38478:80-1006(+)